MNPFLSLQQSSLGTLIEPLGWALVHSLWQMLVVAAIAVVVVRLLRGASATARYAVLLFALMAAVIWPVATFALLPAGAPTLPRQETPPLADDLKAIEMPASVLSEMATESLPPKVSSIDPVFPDEPKRDEREAPPVTIAEPITHLSWTQDIQVALKPWLGWLVLAWFLGMVLCSFRPLLGWITLRRLRRIGVSEVPQEIKDLLRKAAQSLGLKRIVRIKQSLLATVPVVVGYLRPTILLPISVLGHMPVAQLEAILAHELAHVRRHDFLVNLVQTLIETLFFYHPAIWWLSHRIRIEREHCCDDLVVGTLANRAAYGRALIAIEQLRGQSTLLALGAADGSLLARIRRIVGSPAGGAGVSSWSLPWLVIFGTCALVLVNQIPWKGSAEARAAETQANEPPASSSVGTSELETLGGDESKLPSSLRVTGHIVDADTGKPIERAAFQGGRSLPGQPGKVEWGYSFTYADRLPNGEFAQTLNWAANDRRRVLAAGYEPASILDELPSPLPNPPVVERTIRLKKGRLVQGTLRNHLGQGVANGQVFFIPQGHKANIVSGLPGLDSHASTKRPVDHSVTEVKTDAEGRFEIPLGGAGILAASSERVDLWPFAVPEVGKSADLTLPKPGQLTIDLAYWYLEDVSKKEKEAANKEDLNRCFIHVYRLDGSDDLWKQCQYGGNLLVFADDPKASLAKGVRVGPIDRSQKPALIEGKWQNRSLSTQLQVSLPPGHYQIYRLREGERSPQAINIEIKSGESASIDWTRPEGSAVMGTVALPANAQFVRQEGEAPRKLDWSIPHNGYVLIHTKEGGREAKTLEVAKIQKDGAFLIPTHLPPGTYLASAWAWLPESDQSRQFSGLRLIPGLTAEKEFTVSKPPAEGALPLQLQLTMVPRNNQIVLANTTTQSTNEGGSATPQMTEEELSRMVLATLRKPYRPDPHRGSWQGGAFEAEMLMNLNLLGPRDWVVKTLMKVVEGKEPANLQQRRLALLHLASVAPEPLIAYLIQDLANKDAKAVQASDRMFMMHEIEALGRIGEGARAVIPVLIKKLNDHNWEMSEVAIGALVKIGPRSPEVVAALAERFDNSRAVYEAARFGELAKPLGPKFAELLESQSQEIRTFAAYGLIKSGFNPGLGLDFLIKQLDQGTAAERDLALTALGALGSDAKPAAEALRAWGKGQGDTLGREISRTIDRIEKNDRILTHAEEAVKTAAQRKAARDAIEKLQATQARMNAPRPKELDFLASYPKLNGLSLAMTEKDFLDIARNQNFKLRIDLGKVGSKYSLSLGDGQTLIVMFRDQREPCTGLQRIRGELAEDLANIESPTPGSPNRPNELKFTGQLRNVPLKNALQWLANAAALELQIDENDLTNAKLNLEQPVSLKVTDESPAEIFDRLITWRNYSTYGLEHEIRGGKLIVMNFQKNRNALQDVLPDWLKVQRGRPVGVRLDENNEVITLWIWGDTLNEEHLKRLTTLPKLTRLRIYESNRWTPAALDQLANFPHLQVLEISGIKFEGKSLGDEAIKRIVKLKTLSQLTMSDCGVTDLGIRELENLKSLRMLTIGNEKQLTDEALNSIGRMSQLKSLDLESRDIGPGILFRQSGGYRPSSFTEDGLRKLTSMKDLEELNLIGSPVSPEVLNFPNLKTLSLGHSTANDACAARIAQSHHLRSLVLRSTHITNQGLKLIAELPNLTKLNLESQVITDEGIDCLQKLKKLQDISLQIRGLTDSSLKSLAHVKTLNRIELDGLEERGFNSRSSPRKSFTMAGVQQLKILPELRTLVLSKIRLKDGFWGLKELTQLNELALNFIEISSEEIDVLEESLPGTRIHGVGPDFSRRRN